MWSFTIFNARSYINSIIKLLGSPESLSPFLTSQKYKEKHRSWSPLFDIIFFPLLPGMTWREPGLCRRFPVELKLNNTNHLHFLVYLLDWLQQLNLSKPSLSWAATFFKWSCLNQFFNWLSSLTFSHKRASPASGRDFSVPERGRLREIQLFWSPGRLFYFEISGHRSKQIQDRSALLTITLLHDVERLGQTNFAFWYNII